MDATTIMNQLKICSNNDSDLVTLQNMMQSWYVVVNSVF